VTLTSMSVLIIVGPKCTLAASHAAPCESPRVCAARAIQVRKKTGERQTDGRTPDRYITLSARRGQRSNHETIT